jgi:hypothetical protein
MILKTYSGYGLKRHQLTGLCDVYMQGVSGKFQASVAKTVLQFSRRIYHKFLDTVCSLCSPPDLS